MTSMPASRSARAITLAPRSWPSRPGLAISTRIGRDMRAGSVSVDDRDRIAHAEPVARQRPGMDAELARPAARDRGEDPRSPLGRLGVEAHHDAAFTGAHDLDEDVADPELTPDPAVLFERPVVVEVEDGVGADANGLERSPVLLLEKPKRRVRDHVERRRIARRLGAWPQKDGPAAPARYVVDPRRVRQRNL